MHKSIFKTQIATAMAYFIAMACFAQPPLGSPEYDFKYSKTFVQDLRNKTPILDASEIDNFKGGYAIVRKGENFALLNTGFQIVIPYGTYKFNTLQGYKIDNENCGFYNGMCMVRDPVSERYGFINDAFKLVVPCTLLSAEHFTRDGFAWAKQLDAKGKDEQVFINKTGRKFRIVDQTLYNHRILDSYVGSLYNGYREYYSKDGILLFKTKHYSGKDFSEGLMEVDTNDRIIGERAGFVNEKGEMSIPYQYKGSFQGGFHEGLALYEPKADEFKYVYINKLGKPVIQLHSTTEFKDIYFQNGNFQYGYVYGTSGYRGILLDTTGKMQFIDELLLKKTPGFFSKFKTVLISTEGRNEMFIKFSADMTYEGTEQMVTGGFGGGRTITHNVTYQLRGEGIADIYGRIIVPPLYKRVNYPDNSGNAIAIYDRLGNDTDIVIGYVNTKALDFQLFNTILPASGR